MLTGCFQSEDHFPHVILTEGCLTDVRYAPARRIVGYYCSDCHAKAGTAESHKDAYGHALRLDTWQEWVDGKKYLLVRLDAAAAAAEEPPVDVMPQLAFPYQPTQAERDTLLQWIRRGSPNTVSGFDE